ncbi:FUSC family protein [Hydrogenimonas urashimensis]|uniref:FUSC family protein n=1 Tax=Hydrogenimonas urashimensis TaxID=2740515 RepID=UPI001915D91A|nr:FUSC family protein [Hydrogenimonas urashimensis]
METASTARPSLITRLFRLSDQTHYAIKVALAVTLAYLIPFALGWQWASTAAITVIVIAASHSMGESLFKGFLRITGTLIGAVLGIALIAWLPQERALYLLILSGLVTLFLYLGYAYQGDKTIFMLSAMTMMIVFQGGKTDGLFLYGVNRATMTAFGVILFTLVSIYLWPFGSHTKVRDEVTDTGIPKGAKFLLFDPDHLLGALVTFLIFWTATLAWIWFNPPGGFYLVTLATAISLYTVFSPIAHPSLMIAVYTLSFLFSTLAYIFILPHLHQVIGLALFLFVYVWLAFRLFQPEVALFIAMGLSVMNIQNQMTYNFGLYLNFLFLFYAFMFLLLLFAYVPFSSRPETMVLRTLGRFERLANRILSPAATPWQRFWRKEAQKMLLPTAQKLQIWIAKTNWEWFGLKKERFEQAAAECLEASVECLQASDTAPTKLAACMKTLRTLPKEPLQAHGRF